MNDPIARRIAWMDRHARRLAGPAAPARLPVAWAEVVNDPLAGAEMAWERAMAALLPFAKQTRGVEAAQIEGVHHSAPAPQAGTGRRTWIGEQRATRLPSARRLHAAADAIDDASRPRAASLIDSDPAPPPAFTRFPAFDDRSRFSPVAEKQPHPRRPPLAPRLPAVSAPAEGEPWTDPTALNPMHEAARPDRVVAAHHQEATAAPLSSHGVTDRVAESSVTRLTRGSQGLATLLHMNRDPKAALSSSGLPPQPEPEGSVAQLDARDSSDAAAAYAAGATDPIVAEPRRAVEHAWPGTAGQRPTPALSEHTAAPPSPGIAAGIASTAAPALAPPTVEALLEELADRLRFEFMREYGTSAS